MATTMNANQMAAARMRSHHASMVEAVEERLGALAQAALDHSDWEAARDAFVAHVRTEVLAHAQAEESTIYAVAATKPSMEKLIEAMTLEHGAIARLTDQAAAADAPERALSAAAGLAALFAAHAAGENDVILPPLERDAEVDLGDVLARMRAALATAPPPAPSPEGADADVHLDVRTIPHAQRHTLIFGLVSHLRPGQALVLSVDHDPLPLRYQLEAEYGDALQWLYEAEGPREWRVAVRVAH